MTRPSFRTPHRAIAEHWDGNLLPGTDHPAPAADEPECFACRWSHWWFTGRCESPCFHRLQRAHVVPRARGGGDEPANLALLCAHCHEAAPDTTDPLWFWRWVAQQPHYLTRRIDALNNLAGAEVAELAELIRPQQAAIYLPEAWRRVQPSVHGGRMSEATVARVIVEMLAVARADRHREKPSLFG